MSDFEYRIAARCKDGKVSTGQHSSTDLRAVSEYAGQLAAGGEFLEVWVEYGRTVWERVPS